MKREFKVRLAIGKVVGSYASARRAEEAFAALRATRPDLDYALTYRGVCWSRRYMGESTANLHAGLVPGATIQTPWT